MPFIRLAVAALAATLAGCANPQTQRPGELPQTVTLRNSQTGTSTTVKGATVAVVAAAVELSRRNYGGAVRLTSEAIRSGQLSGSELSTAHSLRGDAYFLAGNAARARDDWRTAVEIDARNAAALRGMAIIAHMQRKIPESMQYMQRAIDVSPSSADLYVTRGLLRLQDRRELALAQADFDKAVALKPDLASAYFYRGLVSHMNGRYAQAKGDYEKALEINPAERRAREGLALLDQRRAPADNLAPRSRPNEVVWF